MKRKEIVQSKIMPDLPPKFQFFSVAEVAIILGTSTKTVHDWIDQGLIRSFQVTSNGRLTRVSYLDLEAFIDAHVRTGEIKLPEDRSNPPPKDE